MVASPAAVLRPLLDIEREHVLAVLATCHGNRTHAASILGIDRKTLYRMLLRWSREAV